MTKSYNLAMTKNTPINNIATRFIASHKSTKSSNDEANISCHILVAR
ncbi:hypothetical protein [Helicobacter sp. T3_23-1056]